MSEYRELADANELDFSKYIYKGNCLDEGIGLVTVVAVDTERTALNGLLMVAYANKEAIDKTMETRIATYWSRSSNGLWVKGETSGNYQLVNRVYVDCDSDAVIYAVTPQGPACHKGTETCFTKPPVID